VNELCWLPAGIGLEEHYSGYFVPAVLGGKDGLVPSLMLDAVVLGRYDLGHITSADFKLL